MSRMCYEFKVAVRIEELIGKDLQKKKDFLLPIFGKDLTIDEYDGKLEYISMHTDKWQFRYDLLFYVIKASEEEMYEAISFKKLKKIKKEIEKKIGRKIPSKDIKIVSAAWYNGIDEPALYLLDNWSE